MAEELAQKADPGSVVLVTGGSGYLGAGLVRYLAGEGRTVVSMYRHRIPDPCNRVFPVCSDLSSSELLAAPLRGVDTVVHLAWENTFTGPGSVPDDPGALLPETMTENLRNTSMLLKALQTAGTRRMIFVSALGADRKSANLFLREKYLAEFLILNAGLPEVVILRPSLVFGGEDTKNRFLQAVRRLMRLPGIYPVPAWKRSVYPLSAVDFNRIVLGSLTYQNPAGSCSIFDISGQQGYSIEEIFRIISGRDGRGSRLPVGSILGRTLLPFLEKDFGASGPYTGISSFLPVSGEALNDFRAAAQLSDIYSGPYEPFSGGLTSQAGS